jgi:hypothetical protein
MNSSDTSAKYSCPRSEQNEVIQDSGAADDVDIVYGGVVSATDLYEPCKRLCITEEREGIDSAVRGGVL